MWTFLRGLAILRHPEIVSDLGRRLAHLRELKAIRQRFPTAFLHPDVRLLNHQTDSLLLEPSCRIEAGTILSFGDGVNGRGTISIGGRTWIGQYNNLRAGGGDIRIGDGCLVSQFCTLVASNHGTARDLPIQQQPPAEGRRGVTLEDDVWLGTGVTITPGVTVHQGAVIGAGSVVTKDVPAYEIWAGVPAKKIGERK